MKILTAEVALREETRGLEQAKPQLETKLFTESADALADTQMELLDRTDNVIDLIVALPEGEEKFAKEIFQLTNA